MQRHRSQRDRLFDRRDFGLGTLAAAAAMIAASSLRARAQGWPDKPVRIIEIYPAGVARDSRTQVLAEKLSGILGQQVYVENRPGASGRIELQAAASAAPDGYTFTMIGSGDTINRHLFDLPYDIERDFEPVSGIETVCADPPRLTTMIAACESVLRPYAATLFASSASRARKSPSRRTGRSRRSLASFV